MNKKYARIDGKKHRSGERRYVDGACHASEAVAQKFVDIRSRAYRSLSRLEIVARLRNCICRVLP
jgi:hypothetical protein